MLKRWRLTRLKLELEKLRDYDRALREGETTRSMAEKMVQVTVAKLKIEHEIREIEGNEVDDSGGFEDRLPSGMFVPQKGDK
jgi:hypothetical protein